LPRRSISAGLSDIKFGELGGLILGGCYLAPIRGNVGNPVHEDAFHLLDDGSAVFMRRFKSSHPLRVLPKSSKGFISLFSVGKLAYIVYLLRTVCVLEEVTDLDAMLLKRLSVTTLNLL